MAVMVGAVCYISSAQISHVWKVLSHCCSDYSVEVVHTNTSTTPDWPRLLPGLTFGLSLAAEMRGDVIKRTQRHERYDVSETRAL